MYTKVTNQIDDPRLTIAIVEVIGGAVRPASDQLRAEAAAVCAPLLAPDYELPESTRKAVRGALKAGGYSPTGRGKPASEYLLGDLRERGSFNHISGPVDVNNVVSLETMLPISLLDGAKLGGRATIRIGQEGEGYVFNPAGQWLDVKRCIVTCGADGAPLGTPVKDSMAGKVFDGCTHFLGVIYGASELYDRDQMQDIAERMAELLARETGGEIRQQFVAVVQLPRTMTHCCEDMTNNVNYLCDMHPDPFDCPDNLVYYSSHNKEYGIIVHDGGESYVGIDYCPWCGTKLPESTRSRRIEI